MNADSGEPTRPAWWFWRPAKTNFVFAGYEVNPLISRIPNLRTSKFVRARRPHQTLPLPREAASPVHLTG